MPPQTMAELVADWAPPPLETTDRIDPWPVAAFAALLDQPVPQDGELPPLWHWFSFLDAPPQAALGEDGHPADGHFLPPIPDRRRMFAGGRLEFRAPVPIGAEVVRRSRVTSVQPKSGSSGDLLFVTVRSEFETGGAVAVVEDQDIVYRQQAAGAVPAGAATTPAPVEPAPEEPAPTGPEDWRATLDPDPRLLFRFSALTYNTHRIHYDQAYATGVEGYPGLVVHGPLLALLLLELPRRAAPERRVTAFEYRLRRPAFAGRPVVADGTAEEDGVRVRAGVTGQQPSVTGRIGLQA
jgi:3-methylfumaryl-CoA hydratase